MDMKDPRFQSDFSTNKGVNMEDNPQLKMGAKDSVGSQSNDLTPFSGSKDVGAMGGFGGTPSKK